MKRYFMSIIDFSEIENVIAGDEQLENAKVFIEETDKYLKTRY